MPDDATLHSLRKPLTDGLCAKKLRIAHHMFLEYMFMRIGIDIVKIDKSKAQQVEQTLTGAKRSQDRVRGGIILLIGLIFW